MLSFALSFPLRGEEPESEINTEALRREITEEAPGELVNLNLGDSSVSLRLAGRWKGTLQGSWGMALTPFGASALSGDTPFFAQEGDLTLSLWIRDRWFVEANFADASDMNTYRAGYQGKEDEVVRYVGVGNTGLNFPVFPYLDLGGDTPSSFGAYGHFAAGDLALHSLLRFDAASREERVFVGNRERGFSYIAPGRPQRGVSFVLPDENLGAAPDVYIQDNKGNLTGSDGRRWRFAEPSEYGASARYGLVELSLGAYTGGTAEPEGKIAVYYPGAYSLGNYDGSAPAPGEAPGTFLEEVQNYFDFSVSPELKLDDYPQPGGSGSLLGTPANKPGTVSINGITALVIYEPGTFSPFEKQNRYPAPGSGSSQAGLVKLSSGETIPGYELISLDEDLSASLIQSSGQNQQRRKVYELLREEARDRRSPAERWPLSEYPELYLPGQPLFTEDMAIRFTSYSSVEAFYIGNDVVPGSVQVYRNGIQDPNFTFSSSGGTVNLGNPAGFNEIIRVSYLRETGERRVGSLAAGIGAIWDPGGVFSGKLALGLRWNINSDDYSEKGASSPGTAGLGAEARWDFNRVKTAFTFGAGFEQPDTTGLYRAAGMEGNELVLPLPPGNSFISEVPASIPLKPAEPVPPPFTLNERAALVYRNYRETSILGTTSLKDISESAPVVSGENGPYPATDATLASQVLAAEFDFSSGATWTGFETFLGVNGEFLERAGKIEVPYRFLDFSREPESADGFFVVLQIGAMADKDSANSENPNLIVQKILYEIPPEPDTADFTRPRIAAFNISDEDRVKLADAKYLRLLVIRSDGPGGDLRGRVILAPPIVKGAGWRPVTVKDSELTPGRGLSGSEVSAYEEAEFGPVRLENKYPDLMSRLHSVNSRQRILEISWQDSSSPDADFSGDGTGPGADGRIPALPLSSYRSLSFFARRPRSDTDQAALDKSLLRFVIARGPSSLSNTSEIALDVKIPLSDFAANGVAPGEWTKAEVQYRGENARVLLNGKTADRSSFVYRPSAQGNHGAENNISAIVPGQEEWNSSYMAFFLAPENAVSPQAIPRGNMAIDEVILEETVPSYRLNGGANLEWNLPGAVWEIRDKPVVSDISFQAALESGAQGNPFEEESDGSFGMNGRSRTGFSLLGFRLTGNYSYSLGVNSTGGENNYTWSGGHGVSRSFGPFSFTDSFDDSPADITMNHRLLLNLNTRVAGNVSGEVAREAEKLDRRWKAGTGGRPGEKIPLEFRIDTQAGITEKRGFDENGLFDYSGTWLGSYRSLLPDTGIGAENRELAGSALLRLVTNPLGTELYFRGNSAFSRPREISRAGSLARLDFPLVPVDSELRMLFRAEREYSIEISRASLDFAEDSETWAGSLNNSLPLVFSVPFYSLFDSRMEDRMNKFSAYYPGLNRNQFSDRVEYSLQLPANYTLSSFFIPRRFTFTLDRVLEQRLDTPRDTLNLGASLSFSSVNMFGAMGVRPLFDFYFGDEFSHSLETRISFPKGEQISYQIRANEGMLFYGFTGAELTVQNSFTLSSSGRAGESGRLTDALSAAWTVPMEKTLLGTLYAAFTRAARTQRSWLTFANLAESEYELLRKETLEFTFEKVPDVYDGDYIRLSVGAGHESIVRIFGRLNLSVFGKLGVSRDMKTEIFSFLGTVGTTLNLMF